MGVNDEPSETVAEELEQLRQEVAEQAVKIERLRGAMRDCKCPSDATYTVGECLERGTCGCTPGAILYGRAHEGAGGGEEK